MIVLALDTATDRLSVAAGSPGGPIAARAAVGARRHGALVTALAVEALAAVGATIDRVDALALSDGPGSFTGLRVAAAWVKAIARAREIPVWTASTLLVRAAAAERPGRLVLGTGGALRGEAFVAGYRFGPAIEVVLPPTVLSAGEPLPLAEPPDAIVGDVPAATAPRWGGPGTEWVDLLEQGLPDATRLIELIGRPGGAARIASAADWEPNYGRPAEAQAKWEREHGRPLSDSIRVSG